MTNLVIIQFQELLEQNFGCETFRQLQVILIKILPYQLFYNEFSCELLSYLLFISMLTLHNNLL